VSTCQHCGQGRYSALAGASSESTCQQCVAGKYQPATSAMACVVCQAGKYSNMTGASSVSTCQHCGQGRYSALEGASSESTCQQCVAGKYQPASLASTCMACTSGQYQDQPGQSACISCPAGKSGASNHLRCETISASTPASPTPAVPKFTPSGGNFVGFVEVTVSVTSGHTMHVTTGGETPRCQEAAQQKDVVRFVLTLPESITVKAVACDKGYASAVVSETYVIARGPIVIVGLTIGGDVTASDIRKKSDALLLTFAQSIGVQRERVALRSVTDARRRLLAVSVDFEVLANSAENAGQLQETVKGADFSDVADSLEVSGVTCTFAGVEVYNSQRFLSLSTSFFVCACWSDKFYCDR
jgi:hypothetical protein